MEIKPANRLLNRKKHFAAEQQEKIKKIETQGKRVINLGRGNPDQPTFPKIISTLKTATQDPLNQGYPPYGGKKGLLKAVMTFYKKEYHVDVSEEEVAIFSGSLAALTALPMSLVNPGDYVLTPNPAFFGYDTGVRMAGGIPYDLPLTKRHHFLPQYSQVPQEVLTKSKMLFLNYPNNPTGAGATEAFFEETVSFARKHQIVVVHDFAYSDISFSEKAPSFLQASGSKEVGIELYTLSKTFNMAGCRIAFAVGNKDIIALLKAYVRSSIGGAFGAVQDAAIYGLLNSKKERQELRDLYQIRRNAVYIALTNAGLDVIDSKGSFFLWVKLPNCFYDDVAFTDELLTEKQLAVIPGSVFGNEGKAYIRLSLVSDLPILLEGIERLIAFIEEKQKEKI